MQPMLSPHFALAEFTASQTAARLGIDNAPPPDIVENLRRTAEMLEDVRYMLGGKPILISSGYRCAALNAAVPGSSATSAHLTGKAADFVCPGAGSVRSICIRIAGTPGFAFDQCIREFDSNGGGWVHLAWGDPLRRQLLTSDQMGTTEGIA